MTRILRRGLKGADVLALQTDLKKLGLYTGPLDGHFGPATETAALVFQRGMKLTADGIVGPKTFDLMGHPKPELKPAARPAAVYDTLPKIVAHLQEGTAEFHEACYRILEFDAGMEKQIEAAARRALAQKVDLYTPLEQRTGIPWAMTAIIHQMECNNDPRGVLHNGQRIVGTTKKTTIVPKGRGPFKTWMEAALDAISIVKLWTAPNWSVGWMLRQCERFNGTGYIKGAGAAEITPYVYACTNINSGHGKYTADGKFDPRAPTNTQVGCAAVLRKLEMWGEWKATYAEDYASVKPLPKT